MAKVFYDGERTDIEYGIDNTHILKTWDLTMSEAMELAIDIKCDFDYHNVTSEEIADCIEVLRTKYNILIEDGSWNLSEFLTNYANIVCKGNLSGD